MAGGLQRKCEGSYAYPCDHYIETCTTFRPQLCKMKRHGHGHRHLHVVSGRHVHVREQMAVGEEGIDYKSDTVTINCRLVGCFTALLYGL